MTTLTLDERIVTLSRRERQVAALIASGLSGKEIAVCLNLTLHTVKKHREAINQTTGSRNTADVTRVAVVSGIISINENGDAVMKP